MADCTGLENRHIREGIVSSNLTLSASIPEETPVFSGVSFFLVAVVVLLEGDQTARLCYFWQAISLSQTVRHQSAESIPEAFRPDHSVACHSLPDFSPETTSQQ